MAAAQDPKGLYSKLGVAVDASADDIRRAYRKLALRWHPDKNPDDPAATGEFQAVSAAYEVLSDTDRREMYDESGCTNEEEWEESNMDRAGNIFARFFGGLDEDLDPEEQLLLDEFLRFSGSCAFRPSRRKGFKQRKGRGLRTSARSGARGSARGAQRLEEQMFTEMFGASPSMPSSASVACEKGHPLKRRKADGGYECDGCGADIVVGQRIFDCRKCDWTICSKCHKAKLKEAEEAFDEAEDDSTREELLEAFCEASTSPVREGRRLRFRCEHCGELIATQEKVPSHMEEHHVDEFEAFVEEFIESGGGPPEMMGMGMDMPPEMMGMFMEDLMAAAFVGGSGAPGRKKGRKKGR